MLRFSCLASLAILAALAVSAQSLDEVTKASGVTGGFVVQLGCGDGQLLEALSANPRFTLHGLDTDPNAVRQTQERLRAAKVYGRASADGWDGK
ncbi:MAG: class I SAM-dependent methyltransferase, partial [Victivallales bacterium]|nr:class I SAM-dependent methyltransferase [Victivallales bacterium]